MQPGVWNINMMRIMRKTYRYIVMAAASLCLMSCKIYDDKEYVQEPGYIVAQDTYRAYVNELFMVAELADFFSGYQELREDREAAEAFAESYFGISLDWDSCLFYEYADIPGHGSISLEDDGTFSVDMYRHSYYLDGGVRNGIYSVTDDGRAFRITLRYEDGEGSVPTDTDVLTAGATVRCEDGWIVMDECSIACPFQAYSCSISSVSGKPARRRSVSVSDTAYQASEGCLHYVYSEPDGFTDEFDVEFSDDSVSIVRGGTTVRCLPFDRIYDRSVDYIIG